MSMLVRFADNDKVKSKINSCRDAGLKVFENFITGVTTVEYETTTVLKCSRQTGGRWKVEYNDEFWEEIEESSEESA